MTVTAILSAATPTNVAFEGEEFSNNLLSNFGPLLSLVGEASILQFLSSSMGWADNFLLAMGPVAIATVAVSTIRVGMLSTMKAVIGRHVPLCYDPFLVYEDCGLTFEQSARV